MTWRAADVAGWIVGWKAWRLQQTPAGWRLHAIHYGGQWPTGRQLDAACYRWRHITLPQPALPHRHVPPGRGCYCGIHAGRDTQDLLGYCATHTASERQPRAVGLVRLWGRVIEGSHGWRAEHAYPDRLWLPVRYETGVDADVEAPALDLLAYRVPVGLLDAGGRAEIVEALNQEVTAS